MSRVIANFVIRGRANVARATMGALVGQLTRPAIGAIPRVQDLLRVYNAAMLNQLTLEDLTSSMAAAGQL